MSVKTKTFKCKCLFHRRRRDVPLVRSPRDGNKPQYVIPADGVYLVVVRVWANVNSNPFTASVHVDMLSPSSAVSKTLNILMLSISSSQLSTLMLCYVRAISPSRTGRCSRSTRSCAPSTCCWGWLGCLPAPSTGAKSSGFSSGSGASSSWG